MRSPSSATTSFAPSSVSSTRSRASRSRSRRSRSDAWPTPAARRLRARRSSRSCGDRTYLEHHAEVITHYPVLRNLAVNHPVDVNVFDGELLLGWCWNASKYRSAIRAAPRVVTNHQVALFNQFE